MKFLKELFCTQFGIDSYIKSFCEEGDETIKEVASLFQKRDSEIHIEKNCYFKDGFIYNVGNEMFIEEGELKDKFCIKINSNDDDSVDFDYGAVYWTHNIRENGTFDLFYFYWSSRKEGWK